MVLTDAPVKTAPKSIDFLIIGGGLAGLMCAITLRTVGHRVTLVEKATGLDDMPASFRGMILPPNMTKIFNSWGMDDRTTGAGMVSARLVMQHWETGDMLGIHKWDQGTLEEAGGTFIYHTYSRFWTALLNIAKELDADIRMSTEAVSIAEDGKSAKLRSGETLMADVIIGAGGPKGICRKVLEKVGSSPTPTGRAMYTLLIPVERMQAHPELAELAKHESRTLWLWLGHKFGASSFPMNAEGDFAMYFHVPEGDVPLSPQWTPVPKEEVLDMITTAEPRLKKLVSLASIINRTQVAQYGDLEDWVPDKGHVVVVGEEAHPYPPGPINRYAMGVEDAAVLATLFSHLHDKEQIPSLLYAFQELRQERCRVIRLIDVGNSHFLTIADGPEAEERDNTLRTRHAAGKNVLLPGVDNVGMAALWTKHQAVFGYDAIGEADNWWVQWGLLRERAQRPDIRSLEDMTFGHKPGVQLIREVVHLSQPD